MSERASDDAATAAPTAGGGGPTVLETSLPEDPPKQTPLIALPETALLAFATGVIYLMTSAFQAGFQRVFGFTYLKVGVEDITDTIPVFLTPLVYSLVFALLLALAIRYVFSRLRVSTENLVFFLLPLTSAVALSFAYQYDAREQSSKSIIALLAAYYALDRLVLRTLTWKTPRLRSALPTGEHLRAAQVIVAALLLVRFAYDSGRREAVNSDSFEVCAANDTGDGDRILLQRVGDLVICGKVDWGKGIAFGDFAYFKIDAGKPARFVLREFRPKCWKAPPKAESCEGVPPPSDE